MENLRVCKCCGKELPISSFKATRWGGRVHVCTECANAKRAENAEKKKQRKEELKQKAERILSDKQAFLESLTPRELMKELARRGYKGELTFVQKIDITDF